MPTVLNTLLGRTPARKSKKKGDKKGKDKKQQRKTRRGARPAKKAQRPTANLSPNDLVDVRSQADVSKLNNLMKDSKIIMVLVYADWCGHCQTFKQDVWSKLASMPERKVPMAQIMAEELANTPLASAPVDGYPTVMMVGQDMKPTNLEDTRNLEMMSKLVNSDPEKVLANAPAEILSIEDDAEDIGSENFEEPTPESFVEAEPDYADDEAAAVTKPEPKPKSATPTKEAEKALNASASVSAAAKTKASKEEFQELSKFSALGASATPPNAEDDLLSSQTGTVELSPPSAEEEDASKPMVGGSLYAALLKVATGAAPAALLTGTAMVVSSKLGRRGGRHMRTKKAQQRKRQTRRSKPHGTSRRLTR